VRIAFFTLTGLPIWIAEASVGFAVSGSNVSQPAFVGAVQGVGGGGLRDADARQLLDQPQLVHHREAGAQRADVAQVAARDHDPVGHAPVELLDHLDRHGLLPSTRRLFMLLAR
jgi:hypothetical protein